MALAAAHAYDDSTSPWPAPLVCADSGCSTYSSSIASAVTYVFKCSSMSSTFRRRQTCIHQHKVGRSAVQKQPLQPRTARWATHSASAVSLPQMLVVLQVATPWRPCAQMPAILGVSPQARTLRRAEGGASTPDHFRSTCSWPLRAITWTFRTRSASCRGFAGCPPPSCTVRQAGRRLLAHDESLTATLTPVVLLLLRRGFAFGLRFRLRV